MALVAILGLVAIGLRSAHDVSLALSAVAVGMAGANAHQNRGAAPSSKE